LCALETNEESRIKRTCYFIGQSLSFVLYMSEENAAICDEIARLEEKFLKAKEERRYLLKKLLQLQALTEGEAQAAAPAHGSSLPLTYGVASSVGAIQGAGSISGPSTGAEEPFGKKSKKEKKEKGKENNKLEDHHRPTWLP